MYRLLNFTIGHPNSGAEGSVLVMFELFRKQGRTLTGLCVEKYPPQTANALQRAGRALRKDRMVGRT